MRGDWDVVAVFASLCAPASLAGLAMIFLGAEEQGAGLIAASVVVVAVSVCVAGGRIR